MTEALILLSHGSLAAGAGKSLINLAGQLRQELGQIVEAAYLNLSQPLFPDVVKRCLAQGATTITIFPYFLSAGYYVRVDLPKAIGQIRRQHPQLNMTVTQPFLFHPLLADLVVDM